MPAWGKNIVPFAIGDLAIVQASIEGDSVAPSARQQRRGSQRKPLTNGRPRARGALQGSGPINVAEQPLLQKNETRSGCTVAKSATVRCALRQCCENVQKALFANVRMAGV